MLRYGRLIRSSRAVTLFSQKSVFIKPLRPVSIRLQHTTSTSTEAHKVDSTLTDEQLKERKARASEARAKRLARFEGSIDSLVKSVQSQIEQSLSSKQLYQSFFKSVEKIPYLSQFSYKARYTLGYSINDIISKAISEIKDPNQTDLPVTPQEVLNKAVYYGIAGPPNFNIVAFELFQNGDSKDILQLWVSYLEYALSQGISSPPIKLRNLTILAYLECTIGTKPEVEVIKQLLKIDDLPEPYELSQIVTRNINKSSPRFASLNNAINSLYYSSKDPNSLEILRKAQIASARGELSKVNDALSDIRKISDLSGTPIKEETLVSFMKIYNPIKFQESMNLFNEIVKSGVKPSIGAWNALLESVSRRSGSPKVRVQEVETVYHRIQHPNDETIVKLIECYTRLHEFQKVEALASENNLKSAAISQAYLQSLATQREFGKLKSFTAQLESKNVALTNITFNKLLNVFVKEKKYDDAKAILDEMEAKHVSPDVATFTIVLDLTLKSYRSKGQAASVESINEFFGQMRTAGVEPTAYTFTTIIDSLAKDADTLSSAQELFEILKSKKLVSPVTYVSLISSEFTLGKTDAAERHFIEYIAKGYKVLPANWAMIFEGWSVNSNIPKAREYLTLLKESPNYMHSLLNKFSYYFLLQLAEKKKDIGFANEIFDLITENKHANIISKWTLGTYVRRLQQQGANVPAELVAKL